MKYINSIKTSLLIILICFCTFCSGYTMGSSFVYADSTTDAWTQVTTNQQLVEAFRYYCKSRDLTISGSIADGVTQFTTKSFNGICNSLGIDLTALQAQIKYQTDSNIGTRFLFSSVGINAFNRIFAQFLQDNNLEVGDNVNDTVYDGKLYTDANGNEALVWVMPSVNQSSNSNNSPIYRGGTYLYNGYNIKAMKDGGASSFQLVGARLNGSNYTVTRNIYYLGDFQSQGLESIYASSSSFNINNWVDNAYYFVDATNNAVYANQIITYVIQGDTSNNLYIGTYLDLRGIANQNFTANERWYYFEYYTSPANVIPNVTVNITTNNNTINNNNYEGDTIINNNGDVINNNNPDPDNPNPDTPDLPEPDTQPATDWDIELPDLTVPNWILSGKENKFPFDIPFNVMYALSLLQAEPEAPRLEGTLDFGFYEWEYDLDLSDFDSVAEICRNMEVLAFITGLMLMTRKLIWG